MFTQHVAYKHMSSFSYTLDTKHIQKLGQSDKYSLCYTVVLETMIFWKILHYVIT
jgi:hypothetical protein